MTNAQVLEKEQSTSNNHKVLHAFKKADIIFLQNGMMEVIVAPCGKETRSVKDTAPTFENGFRIVCSVCSDFMKNRRNKK